jgi:Domain of unknown function (DUF4397)
MSNQYDNYLYKIQQLVNRQFILNEIADPPGAFGIVQSVGKPCVNDNFTFVRILNALIEPIDITVYVGDIQVARNLKYKEVSYYLPIPKGNNNIRIYSSTKLDTPLIELNNLDIPTNQAVTIPIWKNKDSMQAMIMVDDVTQPIYPDRYSARIVNLSPDPLTLNVSAPELNYNLSRSLDSGEYEGYFIRDPGKYFFEFRMPSNVGLRPINVSLNNMASRIYTQYIVGTIDLYTKEYQNGYPLELVVSTDGNTIIRRC